MHYVSLLVGCLRENLGFEDTKSEPNSAQLAIPVLEFKGLMELASGPSMKYKN